ncbi:MAG: HAD-IIB family hydrolase [Gammaproteobacteria bacterium]|nr:HAD-IIB family hydrolase [Gammaproteobacteria bacterium]
MNQCNPLQLLLCTDLDRTLLPNGPEQESPAARNYFRKLANHPEIIIAYVSGRDRKLVEQAIINYQIPSPHFVLSDVGSTIYDLRSGQWQLWQKWHETIAPDWRGLSHQAIHALLGDIHGLRLQSHQQQKQFKLSYFFARETAIPPLQREIEARLTAAEISATLTWSIDEPANIGLLDILPRQASKLHAIRFLSHELQIPNNQLIFCGDSGNDMDVLISDIPAVLVANAQPEIREQAITAATACGQQSQLYCAQGNFSGMNGNYSAGILEGVHHYQPTLYNALFNHNESMR